MCIRDSNYPILAFKMKFPENVFEASTSIEWYLDIWGGSGITAVAYTHLDVYKRQVLYRYVWWWHVYTGFFYINYP